MKKNFFILIFGLFVFSLTFTACNNCLECGSGFGGSYEVCKNDVPNSVWRAAKDDPNCN